MGSTNSVDSTKTMQSMQTMQTTKSGLADDLPPGVQLLPAADYSLAEVVGSGAYGTVHLATADEQTYAVKISNVDSRHADLKREMHMLQGMKHPCVGDFHGVFFRDGRACFVLRYYPGGDLLAASDRHQEHKGPMTMPTIQNVLKMVVLAIDWLQIHSTVHRDVKPANIVLSSTEVDDPQCRAYLCDFGSAVRVGPGQRLTSPVGSPAYWAPEVYQKSYGLQSDAWALGVLCFWMIWQQLPKAAGGGSSSFSGLERWGSRPEPSEEALEWLSLMLNEDEETRFTPEESLGADFLNAVVCAAESQESVPNRQGDCSGVAFVESRSEEGRRGRVRTVDVLSKLSAPSKRTTLAVRSTASATQAEPLR